IKRELQICARLKHTNILPVYGYTFGFGPVMAIVSPWAENGNLTAYIGRISFNACDLGHNFPLAIHDNNVIHGDLTGVSTTVCQFQPNVLIHADGTACLADFGLSLLYTEAVGVTQASFTSSFHGNSRWLAPELLEPSDNGKPVRPRKHSDVYSFGGIMLLVLTNRSPYYYLRDAGAILCIHTGKKLDRSQYSALSRKYWDFMEKCWSATTHDRPSTDEV
ncbi:kinase-like protein, partial [Rhizopogon salebrosus TDB-379]